jgi:hypothetical protein
MDIALLHFGTKSNTESSAKYSALTMNTVKKSQIPSPRLENL